MQDFLAVGEDRPHIALDEQLLHQDAPEDGVAHPVVHGRAAVLLGEGVGVVPEPVGTAQLLVDESERRIPGGDFGPPAQWYSMHAQAVVDQGADTHGDRARGQDLEAQPGWRQPFEIPGVGEELENLGARAGEPGLGQMFEDAHLCLLLTLRRLRAVRLAPAQRYTRFVPSEKDVERPGEDPPAETPHLGTLSLPELFAEASELAAEERETWLQELASSRPGIAAELRSLLAAAQGGDSWIARPLAAREALVELSGEGFPESVGPFRLEREIGRGGMGRVYLAVEEREAFRRRVALKLLDAPQPSAEAIRRFRAEVRLLAALEHPGIARFLDGGQSADGTWYLALEFVEGRDLIRDADERGLDIRQRIRLFLQVLEAVEYAHRHQVVHRDLKPGNILVDTAGKAHLLDFGISKLVADPDELPASISAQVPASGGDSLTASDLATTRTELRLLTPAYASPEQIRGGTIGPASDIYSLGVVFYELLAGVHPYGGARSSRHELERAALDRLPAPPSTAARHTAATATAPAGITARAPRRRVARDLDAICLRALAKEAGDRYASAAEFARDLERFLAVEPVTARNGGRGYQAGLFVRRHRAAIAAGVALVAAVGITVAVQRAANPDRPNTPAVAASPAPRPFPYSTSLLPEIEELQSRFDREPANTEAGAALAISLLRADREREAALILARLRQIPGSDRDPLVDYVDGALASEKSEPQRALALYSRALDEALATGRGELVGQIRASRGRVLSTLGRREEGGREMELARADFETAGDLASLARVLNDLGIDAAQRNELARAEDLLERALVATKAASPDNTGATQLGNLAHLAAMQGHLETAERRYREVAGIFRELDRPGKEAVQLDGLANTLWQLGRHEEARRTSAVAIELARANGETGQLVLYLYQEAKMILLAGSPSEVEPRIAAMERLTADTGMVIGLALVDDLRGRLLLLAGDDEAAAARLKESLRMAREAGAEDGIAELELALAEGALAAGDLAAARAAAVAAAGPLRAGGERVELFQAEALLAQIDALEGDTRSARTRLSSLEAVAKEAQHVDLRIAFLFAQATFDRASGEAADGRSELAEARRLAEAAGRRPRAAEIGLALAELDLSAGEREAGRAALRELAAQAEAAGWRGLARRARRALAAG